MAIEIGQKSKDLLQQLESRNLLVEPLDLLRQRYRAYLKLLQPILEERLDKAAQKHRPAISAAEATWVIQQEWSELKSEFHGYEHDVDRVRDEALDVITTCLRLLIDHTKLEHWLETKTNV